MNSFNELIDIVTGIDDHETMTRFFREIFTEKEINDFVLRMELLKDLYRGETQRSIALKHKISLCKITRGSRILKDPGSVVGNLLCKRLGCPGKKQADPPS